MRSIVCAVSLSRRGFVTPQPQKRPKSSFVRFEADLPNERWQGDITHWKLAKGTEVEILNVIDDHSRFRASRRTGLPRLGWSRSTSRVRVRASGFRRVPTPDQQYC